MESPVARILRECGTTNKPFRIRYSFSKGTLTYAIAGTYAGLPGRLVDALMDLAEEKNVDLREIYRGYGATTIGEAYTHWQSAERLSQLLKLESIKPPFKFTPKISPVRLWIHDLYGSTETFCKALKLPTATIDRWANGYTKGTPIVVQQALWHELTFPYVVQLEAAQSHWLEEFGGV